MKPQNIKHKRTLQKVIHSPKQYHDQGKSFLIITKTDPQPNYLRLLCTLLKWTVCILKLLPWQKIQTPHGGGIHPVEGGWSKESGSYWSVLTLPNDTTRTEIFMEHLPTLDYKSARFCTHKKATKQTKQKPWKMVTFHGAWREQGLMTHHAFLKCKHFLHYSIVDLRHFDIFMQQTKRDQLDRNDSLPVYLPISVSLLVT